MNYLTGKALCISLRDGDANWVDLGAIVESAAQHFKCSIVHFALRHPVQGPVDVGRRRKSWVRVLMMLNDVLYRDLCC